MPSLFRFLMVVAVLSAATAGGLYVLSEYFEPDAQPASMTP